jgi:hypothetical protein
MRRIFQKNQEDNQFVIDRLLNYTTSAEGGKAIPPRQHGSFRVLPVDTLKIVKKITDGISAFYTLIWNEPNSDPSQPIDHYNIYASRGASQLGVTSTNTPPAVIYISDASLPVVFTIQTVLANGTTSLVSTAPSVSG